MKIEPPPCPSCGGEAHICQWKDTKNPNATWIECDCGMMTDSYHHKDPQEATKMAIAVWDGNRRKNERND